MLMRVGLHYSLAGQWVVLAALSFVLTPPRRPGLVWPLLCAVSLLIHPYFLVMVGALWATGWMARWLSESRAAGSLAVEGVAVIGASAAALWQAGAFVMERGLSMEFGYYRMNLDALLDPAVDGTSVWSYIVPPLSRVSPGEYEGFNFLGLGLVFAVALAVWLAFWQLRRGQIRFRREAVLLGLTCLALTLFAVSNEVSFGSMVILRYPLPERLLVAMGALHGSGRLFWPVFYVIAWASVAQILRSIRAGAAIPVLGVLALLQVVDTSAGWWPRRAQLNSHSGRTFSSPLQHRLWSQAGQVYRTVRLVRWRPLREKWATFAIYADAHRMSTEAAYLTRVDNRLLDSIEQQQVEDISRGRFEPTTLYVLDDGLAASIAEGINPRSDLLTRIDGFWVLLPGWNNSKAPPGETR